MDAVIDNRKLLESVMDLHDALQQIADNKTLGWIQRENIIFKTDITKPDAERTDAERWEKIAFSIYNDLVEKVGIAKQILADQNSGENL